MSSKTLQTSHAGPGILTTRHGATSQRPTASRAALGPGPPRQGAPGHRGRQREESDEGGGGIYVTGCLDPWPRGTTVQHLPVSEAQLPPSALSPRQRPWSSPTCPSNTGFDAGQRRKEPAGRVNSCPGSVFLRPLLTEMTTRTAEQVGLPP